MEVILYPTTQETLELHEQLIRRFGGSIGVRDPGLLESALLRPQTGYYDALSLQTAALLQSLIQNDSFVDGNKRVAFATTAIFLRMNGYRLQINAGAAETFLIDKVIQERVPVQDIAAWLETCMEKC
jgi:death-on-curing protein